MAKTKISSIMIIAIILLGLWWYSGNMSVGGREDVYSATEYGHDDKTSYNEMVGAMTDDQSREYFLAGGRSTKIGGSVCSEDWDKHGDYTPSDPKYARRCVTNNDHNGLAYLMWETTGGQWTFMGEKQITKGGKQCHTVEYGHTYYWEYYYCDDTGSTTCYDSDNGQDAYRTGSVTMHYSTDKITYWDDSCSGNILTERYCDSYNTVQSVNINSNIIFPEKRYYNIDYSDIIFLQ